MDTWRPEISIFGEISEFPGRANGGERVIISVE
jgi:hypothetical protein